MKKKYFGFYSIIIIISLLILGCSDNNVSPTSTESETGSGQMAFFHTGTPGPCGILIFYDVITMQDNLNIGYARFSNDSVSFIFKFRVQYPWAFQHTYLFVGNCNDIPLDQDGNPQYQLFPYQYQHSNSGTAWYTIPLSSLDECFCVVAFADVAELDANGNVIQTDGAWVNSDPNHPYPGIPTGNSGAMIFNYCEQPCAGTGGGGDEGCTPGYWKNHLDEWIPTGYTPSDDFDTVFGVDYFSPNITLLEAVNAKGGGVKKLARHGTAALLSASHPGVNYPASVAEVISLVQSGDSDTLGGYNELGCPLDN